MTTAICCSPSGLKETRLLFWVKPCISCVASDGVLGWKFMGKMRNAPELLSCLREVSRCMALAVPSAADEVRMACRALVQTTEAESAEIAAAGADLAKAAEGVSDAGLNLRLHLRLQTLMAHIQTAAESSQAGRIWAAAQNLAELLLVVGKFLDSAPEP